MKMIMLRLLGLVTIFAYFSLSAGEEQHCPRYHYEEQILSKVVRLEHRLELLEDKVQTTTGVIDHANYARCPDGWMPFQGSCYLFHQIKMDFDTAEILCGEYHAHLVHVDSGRENTFLKNHLKDLKEDHYRIGLSDVVTEGTFKWSGTDRVASFTDWNAGQPDDSGGVQDCGLFNFNMDYKWDDSSCLSKYKFICEKKADNM